MHYMASRAMCEHDYNCLHDSHLDLQDCMHHPIAFIAEMMGNIMYLHQALRQPDTRLGWEFQFLVPISGTPIVSGVPIPFSIPKIPVGFFF
jgi:hypothetical protein